MNTPLSDRRFPDRKQRRLIESWRQRSCEAESHGDYYAGFISEWIAFNAFCCGLFKTEANKMRADLKGTIDVSLIGANALGGSILTDSKKIEIGIESPCRIRISIKNRYTEDLVFEAYVKAFGHAVSEAIDAGGEFSKSLDALRAALCKGEHHYLMNMAKSNEWDPTLEIRDQADRRFVILFEDSKPKTIKSILYQVRCNIFHGEKMPGEPNDDRIVQAALPVLRHFFDIGLHKIL